MGRNELLPLAREVPPFLEQRPGRFERRRHGVERSRARRSARDARREELLQALGPREQHLALVGEVAEERALREPRALGDFDHCRLLEPALAEELQGGALQALASVRFPAAHGI